MTANRAAPAPDLVHIGLGNFHRAHQIPFTADASSADRQWAWAAFSGRSGSAIDRLGGTGAFHLLVRGPEGDRVEHHTSLTTLHRGEDRQALDSLLAADGTVAVTLTVTEAGYRARRDGTADFGDPEVAADLERLTAEARSTSASAGGRSPLLTAPARLISGLDARRRAGAGPISLVPCDNVPSNAAVLRTVLTDLAERVDRARSAPAGSGLAAWIREHVDFVGTVVDRITPRAAPADREAVAAMTGAVAPAVVVTEPFREWILSSLPERGPDWASAGAVVATNLLPFEQRKLHLLNGAHSILAYMGLGPGHVTVADAIADDGCRAMVEAWWDLCEASLIDAGARRSDLDAYRSALLERFANPRLPHLLAQIAVDGSEKLPIRLLPILRAERSAGRLPAPPVLALAAWVRHVRSASEAGTLADVRSADLAAASAGPGRSVVQRLVGILDSDLAADAELIAALDDQLG